MRTVTLGNHEYTLTIDAFVLDDLRNTYDLNLSDPRSEDIAVVLLDEVALVKTLWVCCKDSAPVGQTFRGFCKLAVGEALEECGGALEKELLGFFRGWKRKLYEERLKAFEEIRQAETDPETVQFESTRSDRASSSPESSESRRGA